MLSQVLEDKEESTLFAITQVLKNCSDKPETHDLILRIFKSTASVINTMQYDLLNIKGIHSAEGPELMALITQEIIENSPLISKQAIIKLRGKIAFNEQLVNAGGSYTTEETANLLNTSTEGIRKRFKRNTLLAITQGGKLQFPVWQFSDSGVISGFSEILSYLDEVSDVSAIQFFLGYDEDLGMTPIEALKQDDEDKFEMVKILAQQWEQHTAR